MLLFYLRCRFFRRRETYTAQLAEAEQLSQAMAHLNVCGLSDIEVRETASPMWQRSIRYRLLLAAFENFHGTAHDTNRQACGQP